MKKTKEKQNSAVPGIAENGEQTIAYTVKDVSKYLTRNLSRLTLLWCCVPFLVYSPWIAGIVLMFVLPFENKRNVLRSLIMLLLFATLLTLAIVFIICTSYDSPARGIGIVSACAAFPLPVIFVAVECCRRVPVELAAAVKNTKRAFGRKAKKALLKELRGYVHSGDEAAINEAITRENERYESVKDIAYEPDEVIKRTCGIAAALEGKDAAADLQQRMKALYREYNYAELRTLVESYEERSVALAAAVQTEGTSQGTIEHSTENSEAENAEEAPQEFIRPSMSEKGKKAIMITLLVSYGLLLIAGILFLTVPPLATFLYDIGICEEVNARSYEITIGMMWLALLPTIGYYFATISPFKIEKKPRIIIAVCTTVLLVLTNVAFFLVVNLVNVNGAPIKQAYLDGGGNDVWFTPATMISASLAFMIVYALTMFRLSPDKIETEKPQKNPEGNFFDKIMYGLRFIVFYVVVCIKAILKFKEKHPEIFILVVSLVATWLVYFAAFIIVIVALVMFFTVLAMTLLKVMRITGVEDMLIMLAESVRDEGKNWEKIVINEGGYEVELTKNPYATMNASAGVEVYYDEYGHKYVSDDGGRTVHREE